MAKSFAEAFQLAQALKPPTAKTNASLPPAETPAAPQTTSDRDLWAEEAASVKPLCNQNGAAPRYSTMTGSVEGAGPIVPKEQKLSPLQTGPIAPKAEPGRRSQKPRNANLEEARKRFALLREKHSPVASSAPRYPHLREPSAGSPLKRAQEPDRVTLTLTHDAKVIWNGTGGISAPLVKNDLALGTRTQLADAPQSVREVVIGFDFGTSSAKVVVGDRGLNKAHAVPFRAAMGIDAYLLPARLFATDDKYSLHGGTRRFDDLKLALLANANDPGLQSLVVAYLALAIRETRAWLFTAHADDYSKTEIVWSLALGLPAENLINNNLGPIFSRIGAAAWAVAGGETNVSSAVCLTALQQAVCGSVDEELEVTITPEIAAQIYGFVSSSSFDIKARNLYLMADVGAGTVDTCLFRVVPAKGGQWSFEIYAAAVEGAGVMNLHRHRISWWQQHLAAYPAAASLCKSLEDVKLRTENEAAIPASYDGYLAGVKAEFSGNAVDPDKNFFRIPLLRQVQSHTLHRAYMDGLLGTEDIAGVPFFLCGGGTRLSFYQDLRDAVHHFPGCSWLSARSQELVIPENLRAEGVGRSDYDRLTVAYGLSMLNLADLATVQQMPKSVPQSTVEQWRVHYVDKDQC